MLQKSGAKVRFLSEISKKLLFKINIYFNFIQEQQGSCPERNDQQETAAIKEVKTELLEEKISSLDGEIKIDIDF